MIDIKDKYGNIRHSVEITEKCVYNKELMSEECVQLYFDTDKLIRFQKGDYIHCDFGRFEIVTINAPKLNVSSDGGYSYEQKFHVDWEKWKNRVLFYKRQKGSEKAWKMTQRPQYFLNIIKENLSDAGFGDWSFQVDASLTEMKLVEFDGTNILDALTKIAETWETEWWITDNVIHLSRCEYGSAVNFEIGDIISDMEQEDGQDSDYVTRLYAFGSTRNLPKNYRKNDNGDLVIEGVVESRLKLPEGIDRVDAWENIADEDVVEGVVVFDDVYPRRIGSITAVTTKEYTDTIENEDGTSENVKWNAFRFTDEDLTFSKDYIIPGEELRLVFQSGSLAGMDFALTFNPDGYSENDSNAQVWEIVRNDDYGIDLPSDNYKPKVGDNYILYGYDTKFVAASLVPEAEQELLAKTKALIVKKSEDKSVYNCPTNPIRCAGYKEKNGKLSYSPIDEIDLDIGQAVKLISDNYFNSGSRVTRIRGFEKRLDNKYNCTYNTGETSGYSRTAELDAKVEALTYNTTQYISSGGSSIYILKKHDGTTPTDHNVFSSLRTIQAISDAIYRLELSVFEKYLRKDVQDEAEEQITFNKGLISLDTIRSGLFQAGYDKGFGWSISHEGDTWFDSIRLRKNLFGLGEIGTPDFSSGFTGYGTKLDLNQASLELDYLTIRKTMRVYELVINQLRGTNGNLVVSDFNKLESVEDVGYHWRCWIDDYDGEMYMNMRVNDILRCQVFDGNNVKYYKAKVTAVDNEWFEIDKNMIDGIDIPAAGDVLCRWNNYTDTDRQGLIYLTSSDSKSPYIDILDGGPELTEFQRLRVRLGRLDGITDPRFPDMKRYGLYTDAFYGYGELVLHSSGQSISTMFSAIEGRITAEIKEVKELIPEAAENILRNSTFNSDTFYWNYENTGIHTYTVGGKLLFVGGQLFQFRENVTGIIQDSGRRVLKIIDNIVVQSEADFIKSEVESDYNKYELSFTYKINKAGKFTIGISGTQLFIEKDVEPATWKTETIVGEWEQVGNFQIGIESGELLIYNVSLKLSNNSNLYDMLEALRVEFTSGLDITAQQAKLYSDAKYTDLYGRVTSEYNAAITVSAQNINLSITTVQNNLSAFKSQTETSINLINGQIALKVNKSDFDSLGNRVSTSESTITQLANQIALKVSKTDFDTLFGRVSTTESNIIMLSNSITAKVSQTEYDSYKNLVSQTYATTVWTSSQISNYVLKTNYNGESIASLINQSAEGVKILANKVEIKLGEYNLIKDSEYLKTTLIGLVNTTRMVDSYIKNPVGTNKNIATYYINGISSSGLHMRFYNVISKNGTYTFSAYIKASKSCRVTLDVADNGNPDIPYVSLESGVWKRCYVTTTVKNYSSTYSFADLMFLEADGSTISNLTINITMVKLEEGNVLTTWTSHPDEVSAAVKNAILAAMDDLGDLAYQSTVEAAMQSEHLLIGGYLKNTLIDTEWVRTQIITANYISALNVNFQQGIFGPFTISGQSLVNTGFSNNAGIIMRNDSAGVFAAIGGNVMPASAGLTAVARFENNSTNGFLGSENYALVVKAAGSYEFGGTFYRQRNHAIHIAAGWISGLSVATRQIDATTYLTHADVYVSCYNSNQITVYLKSSPETGKVFIIRNINGASTIIHGNGILIHHGAGSKSSSIDFSGRGCSALLVYDGQFWCYNLLNN